MNYTKEDIRTLIIEKLDDSISPEDDMLLKKLIETSPAARMLWEDMRQYFTNGDGKQITETLNTSGDWEALSQKLDTPPEEKHIPRLLVKTGIAAAIIAAAAGFYYFTTGRNIPDTTTSRQGKAILLQLDNGQVINLSDTGNGNIKAGDAYLHNTGRTLSYSGGAITQYSTIFVPAGMDYKITLSDSSELWLNAATKARFPLRFTGDRRELEINGEAFIKVAPHAGSPFIAHLPHADVEVLGTEFNVNSYDSGNVRVSLVQGNVNIVTANGSKRNLKPGLEATCSADNEVATASFNPSQVLAWMKGEYIFSGATVQDIAAVLQRMYNVTVIIDNHETGMKRFSGIIYKQENIIQFLKNLTASAEVTYYFAGETIHLK